MPLPGQHNMQNALAAAAVGRIAGFSDDAINAAIRSFRGVEHRLELVGEWAGVRWYNDSKATNPDAGRVALSAFPGVPLVLIAGGYGSDFDLSEWLRDRALHPEAVVADRRFAPECWRRRCRAHRKVVRAHSLEEAVELAASLARPGGVVLLSPAYKSFDMFKDFEDRGNQFKALVQRAVRGMSADHRRERPPARPPAPLHDRAAVLWRPRHGHERQRRFRLHTAPVGPLLRGAPGGVDRPIGFAALFVLGRIDYRKLRPLAPAGAAAAGILMLLVLVPHIGVSVNGARRWFEARPARDLPAVGVGQARVRRLHRALGGPAQRSHAATSVTTLVPFAVDARRRARPS